MSDPLKDCVPFATALTDYLDRYQTAHPDDFTQTRVYSTDQTPSRIGAEPLSLLTLAQWVANAHSELVEIVGKLEAFAKAYYAIESRTGYVNPDRHPEKQELFRLYQEAMGALHPTERDNQ